jgi:hypothetical protein
VEVAEEAMKEEADTKIVEVTEVAKEVATTEKDRVARTLTTATGKDIVVINSLGMTELSRARAITKKEMMHSTMRSWWKLKMALDSQ